MQDEDSLIKCFGLLTIDYYLLLLLMLSSSRSPVLSLSVAHHFEHFALKSPKTIEQAGCWLFILERRESRSEQKLSSSSWLWLGDLYRYVKKHFSLLTLTSVTKHSFILLRSLRLICDKDSLKYMQTPPLLMLFRWSTLNNE